MSLPIGYRFAPSDVELVSFFLKKKVTCQLPPSWNTIIVERDIYAEKSPWNVFSTNDPWVQVQPGDNTKMCIYIFTTLKFLGKKTSKKRMARMGGCGSWHAETGPQEIVDKSGVVIGKKEMFSYESRDESLMGLRGHWYMHEYALTSNSGLEASEGRPMNYVICKITRDGSKKLRIVEPPQKKRNHVSDQEESNYCATAPQPDQYNAKNDFLDGFSGKLENMLEDGVVGFDDVACTVTTNMEHNLRNSSCSTAPLPNNFLDGFSIELENMLVSSDDDVACTMTTNMEDNLRNSSCSTTPLVDEFLNSFPEVEGNMLGSDDMASLAMKTYDEFWEGIDSEIDDDDVAHQEGFDGQLTHDLDPEPAAKKMRYDDTREFIHV